MAKVGKALESVLEGYASFLRERMLAPLKHQPHLVRWVREFLLFAEQHRGYTFQQTLDLFLAAVGERVGIKSWQIHKQRLQCASTAINTGVPASMVDPGRPLIVHPQTTMKACRPFISQ